MTSTKEPLYQKISQNLFQDKKDEEILFVSRIVEGARLRDITKVGELLNENYKPDEEDEVTGRLRIVCVTSRSILFSQGNEIATLQN
jgi:hypothetical protein